MAEFVRAQIFGTTFEITSRYSDLQPVGMGAFGLVCSARDQLTNQNVAVKKIMKPFSTPVLAKRTYRELKLLKHLRHENVISLSDIFISPLEDMYVTRPEFSFTRNRALTRCLQLLRHRAPRHGSPPSPHVAAPRDAIHPVLPVPDHGMRTPLAMCAQLVPDTAQRGLKYVHSAGVVHRDLKPSNILVNENCDLKICDFGLARICEPQMTSYVTRRFCRAPEVIAKQTYGLGVDIWSSACIFAEMLNGLVLFPSPRSYDS
jgi:p38 MAP kinase